MEELSRMTIEEYCNTHNIKKSRYLGRLVEMSYDLYCEGTDDDAIFLSETIQKEKDPELKEAIMDIAKRIRELRESVGENRSEFSKHTGIPVRTIEDWEAGRRTPPEYIPRLIAYQLKYEEIVKRQD